MTRAAGRMSESGTKVFCNRCQFTDWAYTVQHLQAILRREHYVDRDRSRGLCEGTLMYEKESDG